jgi:hypothetical protein
MVNILTKEVFVDIRNNNHEDFKTAVQHSLAFLLMGDDNTANKPADGALGMAQAVMNCNGRFYEILTQYHNYKEAHPNGR